ncbi:MAG: hypothetical protein HW387_1500 [Parachlamydiales bacterium]|nr:hypothetical protein [Parachlamydiales bacterium]
MIVKKIYSLAALALIAASSMPAQQTSIPASEPAIAAQQIRTGQDIVTSLRQSYESGAYDAFLANLQSDYQQMVKSSKFSEFITMREAPAPDVKLKQLAARYEEMSQQLAAQRNDELKAAIAGQSDALAQQIQSITQPLPTDQKEALQYLSSLRFKTPDKAGNQDEKKLIEIDLASEFKVVHLDAQYAQKPFVDRMEKHMIINMDMMRQMVDASKSFQDSSLQNKVQLASLGFDTWQARNWDLNLLNQIVRKPGSDSERKIASIMTSYQAKKADLYQKEFLAKLDQ